MPYVTQCLEGRPLVVGASDYVKALPYSLARWVPGTCVGLGTDGFGRSEGRAALRDFFEVDARHITLAVLDALADGDGKITRNDVARAIEKLGIDPDKPNPRIS